MRRRSVQGQRRTLRFRKVIRAPLPFVYRWCTDFREDDHRLTEDIYHYAARILLREPRRIVREVVVPGPNRNRNTELEIITLAPPNGWSLRKLSVTDDKRGTYRLTSLGSNRTALEMRFQENWKASRLPNRGRYRALFDRVWDRYVQLMEAEFRRLRSN